MKQARLINLWTMLIFGYLMMATVPLLAQNAAEQRKQFFLEALLNPEGIEEQVKAYAQYKGKRKYKTLYSIYESCKEDLSYKEKAMKAIEEEIAQYEEPYKQAMKESLMIAYMRPPSVYSSGRLGYFVQSYLMSFRADVEDELTPAQIKKVDKLLLKLDRILMLSYQSKMMSAYDYDKISKEPAEPSVYDTVYMLFVRGLMNLNNGNDNGSNAASENENLVKIIRYGSLIEGEYLPNYGIYDGYTALIYKKGVNDVRFVPLSTEVLSNVSYYQEYIDQYGDPYSQGSIEADSSYLRYWQPIQAHLGGLKEILLEPAGIYYGIALKALRTPTGGYLSDHLNIHRVYDGEYNQTSSYSRSVNRGLKNLLFEIFGYPDYDYDIQSNQPIVDRTVSQESPEALSKEEQMLFDWVQADNQNYPVIPYPTSEEDAASIQPLVMSKIESRVLHKILTQYGMEGRIYLDSLSNQFNLTQIESPRVLHLTTHTTYGGKVPLPVIEDTINGGFKNNATRIFLAGARESMNTRVFYDNYYSDVGKVMGQHQNDIMTEYYSQIDTTQKARLSVGDVMKQTRLLMKLLDSAGEAGLSEEYQAQLDVSSKRMETFPEYDGVIMESEVLKLNLSNTELVSLSSCGPQGVERSPKGLLALSTSFLKAGAESVLGSMWPVNDEASALFMLKFYKYWASGKSKSVALQLAQKDVRSIHGFEHPHFWAGWMLYGKQ